jgi:hypothetical protein
VDIATGEVTKGHLPKKAAKLVRDWCLERQGELMANWSRAKALEPLERIAGADSD